MKPAEEKEELDVFGWNKVRTEYALATNSAYHLGLKHGAEDMRERAACAAERTTQDDIAGEIRDIPLEHDG